MIGNDHKEEKKLIPNLVTGARIALTPLIFYEVCRRDFVMAIVLFAVAAATDWLDGWLARKLRITTRLGAYLDPVADKLLLGGTFLALGITGIVLWGYISLVLGRDILILAAGWFFLAFTPVREMPPNDLGKKSTLLQIVTVLLFIVAQFSGGFELLALVSMGASALLTGGSGILYALQARELLKSTYAKSA